MNRYMRPKRLDPDDLEHVLHGTAQVWDDMRNQRILITGGTGFFGCWLVETFCHINRALALNARATLLTRDPEAFAAKAPHLSSDPAITLLCGDVRSFPFPAGDFRFVIHAATQASVRQAIEQPLDMLTTIIAGTQRTLEFAASHGSKRFLLTSTGAIYGAQPVAIPYLDESYTGAPDPLAAASLYGEGKRAAELTCSLFCRDTKMECAIARCWSFCGPHLPLDAHFAIGNFIGDALAGRPVQIAGDGTPRRSYLYGSDLAIWLWTMLFRAPSLVPIHVGSCHDLSILELARTVTSVLNPGAAIRVAGKALPGSTPAHYVPCTDRARELLGLRQTIGLEGAIRRTARWYREPQQSV